MLRFTHHEDPSQCTTIESVLSCAESPRAAFLCSYVVDWDWALSLFPTDCRLKFCVNWSPETQNSENPLPRRWREGSRTIALNGREIEVFHPALGTGLMHVKLFWVEFDSFVRIVISSANLTKDDWCNLGQVVWIFDARKTEQPSVSPLRDDLKYVLSWLGGPIDLLPYLDFKNAGPARLVLSVPHVLRKKAEGEQLRPNGLDALAEVIPCSKCPEGEGLTYQASSVGGITNKLLPRFMKSFFGAEDTDPRELKVPFCSVATVRAQVQRGSVGAITLRFFQSTSSTLGSTCVTDFVTAIPFHSKLLFHQCQDPSCTRRFVLLGSHNLTADSWCQGRDLSADPRNFELSVRVTGNFPIPECIMKLPARQPDVETFVFLKHKRILMDETSESVKEQLSRQEPLNYHWLKFQCEFWVDDGRH